MSGVPATIGILDGVAHVGFDPDDLIRLVSTVGHENTLKLSRRDLSYACGLVKLPISPNYLGNSVLIDNKETSR